MAEIEENGTGPYEPSLKDGGSTAPDEKKHVRGGAKAKEQLARYCREIESLRTELEEKNRVYQRLQADFDNHRKRTAVRQEETRRRLTGDILKEFLPVLDNLQRALAASVASSDAEALREGLTLVERQFREVLSASGLQELEVVGSHFDPALCEAVMFDVECGEPEGTVVEELRKGYKLGEEVVRPAMVKVAGCG